MPAYFYTWEGTFPSLCITQNRSFPLRDAPGDPFPIQNCFLLANWKPTCSYQGDFSFGVACANLNQPKRIISGQVVCTTRSGVNQGILQTHTLQVEDSSLKASDEQVLTFARTLPIVGGRYITSDSFTIVALLRVKIMPSRTPSSLQGLLHCPQPNNVQFVFPREHISLWANATLLKAASPHFAELLTSDFSEGAITSESIELSSEQSSATSSVTADEEEAIYPEYYNDSDSEEERSAHLPKSHKTAGVGLKRHVIKVTGFQAATYSSVLKWIYSGDITFATLRSCSKSEDAQVDAKLAVSAKSVYRLCHFLEMDDLKKYALDWYRSQLSIECAPSELFSNLSGVYEEVREVTLDFAVQNWKEVKASEGMKQVAQEIKDGKRPFAAAISVDLFQRL